MKDAKAKRTAAKETKNKNVEAKKKLLSVKEKPNKKQAKPKAVKDPNQPKRPPTAFFVYLEDFGLFSVTTEIDSAKGMKMLTHATERIDAVDETNMTVTYTVIEGEIMSIYKVFRPTLKVIPEADANSCTVSWSVEFEPTGNEIPPADPIKEAATSMFKTAEGYLLTTA